MKRILFSLIALMSVMGINAQDINLSFASLSSADATAIAADATNWKHVTGDKKDYYGLITALSNAALAAQGTELDYAKGLKFSVTANAEGNLRADVYHKCMFVAGSVKIVIPSVAADKFIKIDAKSSSSSTARTINLPTNVENTSGKFGVKSTDQVLYVGKVTTAGDVELTFDGSQYIYSIKVADKEDEQGTEVTPTPTSADFSTSANASKNQAVITLKDDTKKYYNTESVSSIDIDAAKVTVNQAVGSYTFDSVVKGIAFNKASEGTSGTVINGEGKVEITEAKGWLESAYIKFNKMEGATKYNVYVKGGQYADYTKIDDQLVRNYGTYGRADIVGLKAASDYAIKIVAVDSEGEKTATANEATDIIVKNYSREGFAFLNGYAPGAYNNDGTLKAGAKVMYVTKNTAKTIKTTVKTGNKDTNIEEFTGIQAIIDAYQKGYDTTPITFRLIGLITKDDLDGISSSEEGLQIKGKNADSEMNITIEGIGDDATVYGFGFLVRNAKGVEFRNFASMRCMDDGISLDTDNSNIWIHHTDIFYGKHGSGDHAKGDGATDVKSDSKYVTVSYNRYWDTGKTNMFGMKSESGPNYISYDHNWFDHSDSRHPRVRTMSVHVWNNYFDNVAKYGVGATTGASVFVEGNYFYKTKKPILSSNQGSDALGSGTFSGEDGGIIKAYDNHFDRTAPHFSYYTQNNPTTTGYDAYEVTSRDQQVPETETTKAGNNKYNNFDTNASLMYTYNAVSAEDVPALVTGYYGAGRMNHGDFTYNFTDNVGIDDDDSAYDNTLGSKLDNYKSSLVGIFGDENSQSGEQGGQGGNDEGGEQGGEQGGGEVNPDGTILCSFNGSVSNSLFTAADNYGDGKITYDGTFYKKGEKMDSKGSISFTPTKNYTMTIVLATAKSGRDVKLNDTVTTVSGTENTAGAYYEMNGIDVTANTKYTITKGSAESLVMLIKLTPKE